MGCCKVLLARFEHERCSFTGLTEADGQHSGGEGIKAAGMPGLAGLEYTPDFLQGAVRGNTRRLVQQDNTVNI
jgi:hypothetical protein